MRLAASIYGPVPKRDVAAPRKLPPLPAPETHQLTMVDAGVEQAQLEWNIVTPRHSDKEIYAFQVLSEILDRGEVGVLYHQLVVTQGLASGLNVNYDPDTRGEPIFSIDVTPSPRKSPAAVGKTLRDDLRALAKQGFDDATVENAKDSLQRAAIFARDSLMMPGYAFGSALTTKQTVADVEEWPDRIKAVTREDVEAALRSLVDNPHSVVGMLLPDPKASPATREAARPLTHSTEVR
jgi:zinc protease